MSCRLSIIIPTYKRTDSLGRLLELLEKQTVVDELEILMIDQNQNGYLQDAIDISSYSHVRHIHQERPNASLARNLGSQHASGEFFLFLDDDLVPDRDFCEKGLNVFSKYDFVECFVPSVNNHVEAQSGLNAISKKVVKTVNEHLFEITDTISAAVFFRKGAFIQSGGFDVLLFDFARTAEDQEFFLRLKFKKLKLYFTTELSVFHDEAQGGGCELRTSDYWVTREKCMRAWIYRYKIQRGGDLSLTLPDFIALYRSVFFNREGLTLGFSSINKQLSLFHKALSDTNRFLVQHKSKYLKTPNIDHLVDSY